DPVLRVRGQRMLGILADEVEELEHRLTVLASAVRGQRRSVGRFSLGWPHGLTRRPLDRRRWNGGGDRLRGQLGLDPLEALVRLARAVRSFTRTSRALISPTAVAVSRDICSSA